MSGALLATGLGILLGESNMKLNKFGINFEWLDQRYNPALDLDPVLTLGGTRVGQAFYRKFGKRLMDLTLVALCAPLLITLLPPLIALVAMDRGNPFYSQIRLGQNGRPFRMWKLRSMVPDAENLLQAHLAACPEAREEWERDQKLKNDPRITKVGLFIRKASLDELPQFWNVITGDMSVIGPRPMLETQRALYPGNDYYLLRPGITGLWQITVRNESSFAERAHFDSLYNACLSFKTDLKILLATVLVVCSCTGH
ncbi:sugar transferase (plasmid) [Salipiger sp. H15]|uniref:Sugar transferase n=1 Tax=Alloyangia sp. H15 TaxID=3029062 RepID=A0AAU8AQN6_9RHOB